MARTKRTEKKSSQSSKRYQRATFNDWKKRDHTPEPSHPDNPCPSQVIGSVSGCNLCFPDIVCRPGERHVCRQMWATKHFQTSKALKLCREQQKQLEDEMTLTLGHGNGSASLVETQTPMAVPTMTSTCTLGVPSSSQSTNGRRPQSFCRSCNALILDATGNQTNHKQNSHHGAWHPSNQLQPSMLCHNCSGPSTSQPKRGLDANVDHAIKKVKMSCEYQGESSSSTADTVADNAHLNYSVRRDKENIFNAPTSSESEDETETPTQSTSTAEQSLDKWKSIDEEEEEIVAGDAPLIKSPVSAETGAPDWRGDRPTALNQFQYLLDNQLYTDCRLIVTYNGEHQEFPCHKLVLARASSMFAKFLYRPEMAMDELLIGEFEPQAVSSMLQFIYSDRVHLKGVASTLVVCGLASQFRITALLAACCSYIKHKMSPLTLCQVLKFIHGQHYELPELQESCLKMVKKNTELVLDCPEFLECDTNILELIVEQQELNISSELVLINACAKWCEHNNGTATHIKALGSVRQYLRFLSLSASQFAEGPAQSSILSQEEKLAIFVALASKNSDKECALPGGLSVDRKPRTKPKALQV